MQSAIVTHGWGANDATAGWETVSVLNEKIRASALLPTDRGEPLAVLTGWISYHNPCDFHFYLLAVAGAGAYPFCSVASCIKYSYLQILNTPRAHWEQSAKKVLHLESMTNGVPSSPLRQAFYTDMFPVILNFAKIRIISRTSHDWGLKPCKKKVV